MTDKELDQIIESLLFASLEPLSQTLLNKVFDSPPPSLKDSIERLNEFYSSHERPYKIKAIAGGFQLVTNSEFDTWISRLLGKSPINTLPKLILFRENSLILTERKIRLTSLFFPCLSSNLASHLPFMSF